MMNANGIGNYQKWVYFVKDNAARGASLADPSMRMAFSQDDGLSEQLRDKQGVPVDINAVYAENEFKNFDASDPDSVVVEFDLMEPGDKIQVGDKYYEMMHTEDGNTLHDTEHERVKDIPVKEFRKKLEEKVVDNPDISIHFMGSHWSKSWHKAHDDSMNMDGGSGSGNWGHIGRPGEVGGSQAGGGNAFRLQKPNGEYTGLGWAYKANQAFSGGGHEALEKFINKTPSHYGKTPNGAVPNTITGPANRKQEQLNGKIVAAGGSTAKLSALGHAVAEMGDGDTITFSKGDLHATWTVGTDQSGKKILIADDGTTTLTVHEFAKAASATIKKGEFETHVHIKGAQDVEAYTGTEQKPSKPDEKAGTEEPVNTSEEGAGSSSAENSTGNSTERPSGKTADNTQHSGQGASEASYETIKNTLTHPSGTTDEEHIASAEKALNHLQPGDKVTWGDSTFTVIQGEDGKIEYEYFSTDPENAGMVGEKLTPHEVAVYASGYALTNNIEPLISSGRAGNERAGIDTRNDPRYSQERKNGATWDENAVDIYDKNVKATSKAWKTMSDDEKKSLTAYTGSAYSEINYVLYRGDYQKGTAEQYNKDRIDNITSAINKVRTPSDMWMERRTSKSYLSNITGAPKELCERAVSGDKAAQQEFIQLVTGTSKVQEGFLSFGSKKGAGLSGGVVINGYAPAETKAVFCEPFSVHGIHHGHWNGSTAKVSHVGMEFETLVQRGASYHFTKVEFADDGKVYIDVDIDTSTCP